MAAGLAFKTDISPQPRNLPFVAAAGMRFFEPQNLADVKVQGLIRFLIALPGRTYEIHGPHNSGGGICRGAGEIIPVGGIENLPGDIHNQTFSV